MNYEKMSISRLTALAEELGVYPEEGSGKDGKVVKKDLLSALKVGAEAVKAALPSQQKYKLDTKYRVIKEGLSNHPVGAIVLNLPRNLGIFAVEEGLIEELSGAPKVSNPRARITE
jgi:hypothetical protein